MASSMPLAIKKNVTPAQVISSNEVAPTWKSTIISAKTARHPFIVLIIFQFLVFSFQFSELDLVANRCLKYAFSGRVNQRFTAHASGKRSGRANHATSL